MLAQSPDRVPERWAAGTQAVVGGTAPERRVALQEALYSALASLSYTSAFVIVSDEGDSEGAGAGLAHYEAMVGKPFVHTEASAVDLVPRVEALMDIAASRGKVIVVVEALEAAPAPLIAALERMRVCKWTVIAGANNALAAPLRRLFPSRADMKAYVKRVPPRVSADASSLTLTRSRAQKHVRCARGALLKQHAFVHANQSDGSKPVP